MSFVYLIVEIKEFFYYQNVLENDDHINNWDCFLKSFRLFCVLFHLQL